MQPEQQAVQPATTSIGNTAPIRPFVPAANQIHYGLRRPGESISTMTPNRLLGMAASEGFVSPWDVEQSAAKTSPWTVVNSPQFHGLRNAVLTGDRRHRIGTGSTPGRTMFVQNASLRQPRTGNLDPFAGF